MKTNIIIEHGIADVMAVNYDITNGQEVKELCDFISAALHLTSTLNLAVIGIQETINQIKTKQIPARAIADYPEAYTELACLLTSSHGEYSLTPIYITDPYKLSTKYPQLTIATYPVEALSMFYGLKGFRGDESAPNSTNVAWLGRGFNIKSHSMYHVVALNNDWSMFSFLQLPGSVLKGYASQIYDVHE